MMEQKINKLPAYSAYFNHLYAIIKPSIPRDLTYHFLIFRMFQTEFVASVPNDDNREKDGLDLRTQFLDSEGFIDEEEDARPCSILEMLIALAYRMEYMISGEPFEKSVSDCFWLFIDNLDMMWMDDHSFIHHSIEDDIDEKLRILNDRIYGRDGEGGLFPLKKPKRDQRVTEIWYQMGDYLLENYHF